MIFTVFVAMVITVYMATINC